KPLTLLSVNGPQATTINGGGVSRCADLAGATLSGFTLTHGSADEDGGGGAYGGTLNNCVLSSNSVVTGLFDPPPFAQGGGTYGCVLNNCTMTGNSVDGPSSYTQGGGDYGGELQNCIVYFNTAPTIEEANVSHNRLANSCWFGDPLFVDTNGWT